MYESSSKPLKVYYAVWIVLGIVGLISFFTLFDTAFPTASIDISIPKEDIEQKAVKFADFLSYSRDDAVIATTFASDNNTKTFLDYKLGGKKANELMGKEIPVWRWQTRICKPFSTEEAYVYSWLDGSVQSFWHVIAKEKKIKSHDKTLGYAD